MKNKLRIANAGGFWGDDLKAFNRQITQGKIDYLTMDFLAEITMSILKKQMTKNPELGYVTDFIEQIRENAKLISEKKIVVITNAGGINPVACGKKITEVLKDLNIDLKVAVVYGDDIVDKINEYYPEKASFRNIETGENFESVKDKLQTANVYLGAKPIVEALKKGAQIIITGRVTDTSITMAPMTYEFGWSYDDWDKLASGIVAGHIIECGAQATGGNFSDWRLVDKWENFGYPIVEVYPDGEFVVTKHDNTGGAVTIDTVKEQLLYEMGNPSEYISPDVIADFKSIELVQESADRVRVKNIKGKPSTPYYKVSMAYEDGYKIEGSVIVSGPDVLRKAEKIKEIFWNRLGIDFERINTEFVGFNACHGSLAQYDDTNEILLRFGAYDYDLNKLNEFSKQIAPLILSSPPGIAVTGGRPRPRSVITYWPALIPKSVVKAYLLFFPDDKFEIETVTGFEKEIEGDNNEAQISDGVESFTPGLPEDADTPVRFYDICLARSGDKGDTANIGVIARNEKIYRFLKEYLTADYMKYLFRDLCKGKVVKYELPNLNAFNFLLEKALDGGGTRSLKIDAQGKTYAQAFLNQKISVPQHILNDD